MCMFSWVIVRLNMSYIYTFFLVKTRGGNELNLRFIILLLHGLY